MSKNPVGTEKFKKQMASKAKEAGFKVIKVSPHCCLYCGTNELADLRGATNIARLAFKQGVH